jgi:hypothetical protein
MVYGLGVVCVAREDALHTQDRVCIFELESWGTQWYMFLLFDGAGVRRTPRFC